MRKLFKSILPILIIVSMVVTMGVGTVNQNEGLGESKNPEQEALSSKSEEKPESKEDGQELEELKEEKQEEKLEDPVDKIKEEPKEEEKPKEDEKPKQEEQPKKEIEAVENKESKEEPKEEEKIEEELIDEIAENIPPIEGEPKITLPGYYYQRMSMMSTGLVDTIEVDKTAIRTKDEFGNIMGCRTYEVTLDITGTPQEAPVDVVLVLDRSGSMNQQAGGTYWNPLSRLYYAKQAAVNFAGRVLGPNGIPGSRVSIVSFNGPTSASGYGYQSQATTNLDLTSNLTTVTNTINNISAVGGTNTEAGFIQGQSVIQGSTSNQNPNSSKVVIMFTDGLPTVSNGNQYQNTTNINHVHIQSAIAAGKNIHQNNIANVFTIGLTKGMNTTEENLADNILTQAQNKGYYPAPSVDDLETIFNDISESLGYSATQAVVVDKVGDNFNLVESSLPTGVTYNSTTREITWDQGTIVSSAQLKYIVQAKPEFEGGMAKTNEYARLTYTDVNGNIHDGSDPNNPQRVFPIPEVNIPILIKIELTDATIIKGDSISLGIGTDPLGENYMSPVTGGDGVPGQETYQWRILGDDTIISEEKNPTVSPTEDTEYKVTVTNSSGCVTAATMKVFVEDKKTSFGIKKRAKESENLLDGAEFVLKKGGVEVRSEVTVNGYIWMNDLLPGAYTLQETVAPNGYKVNNQVYEIVIADDGTITVDPNLTMMDEDGKKVLVIENELLEFSIRIKKIDEKSKELLDGAEFKLRVEADGVVVATETTVNGYIDLDNLIAGTYILEERVAPDGYKLNDTEYTIIIGANGDITVDPELTIEEEDGVKVIVLENRAKAEFPSTGGPGSILFTLLGISLITISLLGYRKNSSKKGRI